MPDFKPLKYREIVKILTNLDFRQEPQRSTSHQTWISKKDGKFYAVTVAFHGTNTEFKRGTLGSIIRQSGVTKKDFYNSLKKKK